MYELPPPKVRAGKWLIFDDNGCPMVGDMPTGRLVRSTAQPADNSVMRSLAYLLAQTKPRSLYNQAALVAFDPEINRHSSGTWNGWWTMPPATTHQNYSPIQLTGPLWFPLTPGIRADFAGQVDVPFYSMDGWQGRRDMVNPSPPPDYITDPSTVYADGGANWGRYFIVGSVVSVTQFITPIGSNAQWQATVAAVPPGQWTFQIVTYANASDAGADVNRIVVGYPWLEAERPGDVRNYLAVPYVPGTPQFTNVGHGDGPNAIIAGRVTPFNATPGCTYQILVTNETDVEYAWALEPIAVGATNFMIQRPQMFGGQLKLRLVEQVNGCTVRVVGQVWAQENAAAGATAWPDLRIEYRAITDVVPFFPYAVQPAQKSGWWQVALAGGGAIPRASLVNVNTKRVYAELTAPSGLMRSFIVPPDQAGQDTTSVYYDGFMDTCFLYDQAVALIGLLQLGQRRPAAKMVDALLSVQNPDGSFPFATGQATLYEHNAGFIRIGAVAWVAYALLLADQPQFRTWFSQSTGPAARAALAYIIPYINSIGVFRGGKGQYVNGVLDPTYVVPWWSTEHNIDLWWAFTLADQLYGSGTVNYQGYALSIRGGLLAYGWDPANAIFWQGGGHTVDTENDGSHALDTHSWGAILLQKWGAPDTSEISLNRARQLYYVTDVASGLSGYTTFIPQDGYPANTVLTPWYEGSFGVALATRGVDQAAADQLMQELIQAQRPDGSYLYALQADPVNDIHPWPAIIPCAWNILAQSGPGTSWNRIVWPLS
jgi:hypothetical protein